MNPRLILLVGCLAVLSHGQDIDSISPVVKSLLDRPDDPAKQRDILRLLPGSVGHSGDLAALSRNMRLDFLEASDLNLMVITAFEIARAQALKPGSIRPPQRGKFVDPVSQIQVRVKQLVLPDVEAFDRSLLQSTEGGWNTLAPPSSFWSLLVLWIDKHDINSPQAQVIKDEVERFSTQPDSAHTEAATKLTDQPRKSKPTPPPSEEPSSSIPWSITVVLIVAATGLLWLLVQKRK